ncbi:MAG TPA: sensor domain-containing diguanylate cyclase [Methylibium sp.]|uniref:GGDEF domain-containing protein n=1 Tax=Methylibium sp. TaxID=2067992 RepID=UPI002DB7EFD9|nr:sensor domain-containing diguanylate cyclase [Methylibium sp.]HEU4458649.1 sensor domain-containing diguanylate cyclase [Methylibium sp.]
MGRLAVLRDRRAAAMLCACGGSREALAAAEPGAWTDAIAPEWLALLLAVIVLVALGAWRLRRLEAQFARSVAETYAGVPTPLAVIARDDASTVLLVNTALFELFGGAANAVQREAVRGRVAALAPALAGVAEPPASAPLAVIELEQRFERLDGQVFWALVRAVRDPRADRPAWLCSLTDVTALQQARERLSEMATTDGLTAVLNRRTLEQRLRVEWQRAERDPSALAALWLDVEQLGRVNDTHGHETGDLALAMLAATCAEALRPTDLIGRWGGDEFVVVLPGASDAAAQGVAARLRERVHALEIPVRRADGTVRLVLHLTLAVGIAHTGEARPGDAPGALTPPDELLAAARAAVPKTRHASAPAAVGAAASEQEVAGR